MSISRSIVPIGGNVDYVLIVVALHKDDYERVTVLVVTSFEIDKSWVMD